MTIASIATPPTKMLSIQPAPSRSFGARVRRAVVTFATRTNRSLLPVTHPGEPTSPPPTEVSSAEPLLDNQDPPMPLEDVLDLMAKNQKLPGSLVKCLANNKQLLDKLRELKEFVMTGSTFTSSRESLIASLDCLKKAENLIVVVYPNQLKMQQEEQSNGDTLVAKLKDITWWQDTYHTIFTSSTILSGYAAFTVGQVIAGKLAVVFGGSAAGIAMAFLWLGKQVDSHKDELKKPVKKCKGISNAITGANKLEQGYLEEIMALVGGLKSDNQSIQAMMGPEAAPAPLSSEIDGKVAALKLGFQRSLAKVDCCIADAKSVREGVIHAAVHHLAMGGCQQHLSSPENWI